MKQFKLLLIVMLLLLALASTVFAEQSSVDPSRMVLGARPLGMGRAFTGLANDANAVFINPAGLTQLKYPAFSGTSRRLFLDETLYTQYMYAFPSSWGSFGIGYTDANVGGSYPTIIDPSTNRITINPSLDAIGYDNNVITLSYANKIQSNIALGANLKYFSQSLSGGGHNLAGRGMGFDLGALYSPYRWLAIGGTYQNLGASIQWNNTAQARETMGSQLKLGLAANILGTPETSLYANKEHSVTGVFDIDMPMQGMLLQSNSMLMHLGAEWSPWKDVFLRGGFDQDLGGPGTSGINTNLCLGIGFFKDGFQFDYAYYPGSGVGDRNPHYFSISYVGMAPPPPPLPKAAPTPEVRTGTRTVIMPALTIDEPADKSLSAKEQISVTGIEKEMVKIFQWRTTQEAIRVTKLPPMVSGEAKGTPEVVTEWVTREIETLVSQKLRPTIGLVFFIASEEVTPFTTGNFSYLQPIDLGLNRINVTAARKYITIYTVPVTKEVAVAVTAEAPSASTESIADAISTEAIAASPEVLTKMVSVTTFETTTNITFEVLATEEVRVFRYDPFKDVAEDHWVLEPIAFISGFGIINGYPDKTFKPENGITRAELTLLLMKTVNIDWSLVTPESKFKDLPATHWAASYIQEAVKAGVVTGYPNGNFEPKKVLTRAEGITILTRFASIEENVEIESKPFDDIAETHWVLKHLQKAKAKGLLKYIKGKQFNPNLPFTRAEATEVLYRLQPMQDKVNLFWEEGMDAVKLTLPKPTQPPVVKEEGKKGKKTVKTETVAPPKPEAPKTPAPATPQTKPEETLPQYEHPIFD